MCYTTYMSTYLSSDVRPFPAFLYARRRALNLSPADLATLCDLTPDMIERMEQGRFLPSPSQAYQLAMALDLDPLQLGAWTIQELLLHPELLSEHVQPEASASPEKAMNFYL